MALLAARRAAALVRPTSAAALLRPTAAGARFSSAPDYSAFVRGLRDISDSLRAEKEHSSRPSAAELRAKSDSLRAATHDCEIVGVLNSVIQSHHRDLVKGIPKDFPFEISKMEGITDITLTRSLKGEQIEVLVSMPKLDHDEECDVGLQEDSNQEDECETSPEEYNIPVKVTISKADGSSLEFTCTANPDNIVIETLSMRQKKSSGEEDAVMLEGKEHDLVVYDEGPHFHELDKNLQEAFHKYLEVRGITPMTAKLLHEHMMSEDSHLSPKEKSEDRRRHLLWLTKLWDFIKKD